MLYSDIFIVIAEQSTFLGKMRIRQVSKEIHNKIKIKEIPCEYHRSLTDEILQTLPDLQTLDACRNSKITDEGIKHLNLQALNASNNSGITDEGIKHMYLQILSANKSRITDEGIKHMNLQTLNAPGYDSGITDEGIKHMNLKKLHASYNNGITDEGIKHMNLHTLITWGHDSGITDELRQKFREKGCLVSP